MKNASYTLTSIGGRTCAMKSWFSNNIDHKNILKLIKVYEDRTNVYLIMEYIKGVSLYKYLKENKSSCLSEKEVKFIFKEILNAMLYCHQKMIAHRDVKLENIIVSSDVVDKQNPESLGIKIKLIDFGFAIKYSQNERSTTYCGTPSYMAPEIVRRVDFDYEKGDVWALGVVLYALI